MRGRAARIAAAGVLLAIAPASETRANGNEFFQSVHTSLKQLVYVGNVRDDRGRLVKGALVNWEARSADGVPSHKVGYGTYTDGLGHYRSIDISLIMASMDFAVDPDQIRLDVVLPGHKVVRRLRASPDTQRFGSIEMNFIVAPIVPRPSLMERLRGAWSRWVAGAAVARAP